MTIYAPDKTDLDHAREPTASELDEAERLTPVELRLGAALQRIPYAVQRKGLRIAVIQAQLKGRSKGRHCHIGELAEALYKRGWRKRMQWEKRGTGVVTLWYPPGVDPVRESIIASWKLPPGRPPKWLARARRIALEAGFTL